MTFFFSALFNDVSSASDIPSDLHTVSPDYGLSNLFEEQEVENK